MPVTPVVASLRAKPSSSDQTSEPITRKRGTLVTGQFQPVQSPGGCALARADLRPFKGRAGGRGTCQHFFFVPQQDFRVGAHIDHQHQSSDLSGASEKATAAASAPTWPAMQGKIDTRRGVDVQFQLDRPQRSESDVASAKGAWPNSNGSMPKEQVVHHRVTDEDRVHDQGLVDLGFDAICVNNAFMPSRTARVISSAPPGFIMRVADAAHQVFAKADLRVHDARGATTFAGLQIAQMCRDRGRAKVNGQAVDRAFVDSRARCA